MAETVKLRFMRMAEGLRSAADLLDSVGRQPSVPHERIYEAQKILGTTLGDLDLALRDGTIPAAKPSSSGH